MRMLIVCVAILLVSTPYSVPLVLSACDESAVYEAFARPERVTIQGYTGDAMEPFITRDGAYLLFNTRNDAATDTNLHYARAVDETTFEYVGEIENANSDALDAVPTMNDEGTFYFVSTRSYGLTGLTLYQAWFEAGSLSDIALVDGIAADVPGVVNFDVDVSPDGATLYFVDGEIGANGLPIVADLVIAQRGDAGFTRLPNSDALMVNINTEIWDYAAAVSRDGLELFFTRYDPDADAPR